MWWQMVDESEWRYGQATGGVHTLIDEWLNEALNWTFGVVPGGSPWWGWVGY